MREPIDLACERLRGYVLKASDEFFAKRENLIKFGDPVSPKIGSDPQQQCASGWLTRRRNGLAHDWAVVRLGVPGVIEEFVIDTTGFQDDCPPEASIEGCVAPHNTPAEELKGWTEILGRCGLAGDKRNSFPIDNPHRFTHIRLNIFPDGGVARLRVLGQPVPNWMAPGLRPAGSLDLAALSNGGHVHSASDMHFGDKNNLIMPLSSQGHDDTWHTKRRRGPGPDWAKIRLVGPGTIHAITLDTSHSEGNCPEKAQLEASGARDPRDADWFELMGPQTIIAHTEHTFQEEISSNADVLWVRLKITPDGSVARLRIWGELSEAGFQEARLLFLNTSQRDVLQTVFKQVCHSELWVREISRSGPFANATDLLKKGATAWSKCKEPDWKEALDGHPRIGEKQKGGDLAAKWSKTEQSTAATPDQAVLEKLKETQENYYQKFGFIFLICATEKSSSEILQAAERRLQNCEAEELQIIAEEQAKIIHLRLEKLLKS